MVINNNKRENIKKKKKNVNGMRICYKIQSLNPYQLNKRKSFL